MAAGVPVVASEGGGTSEIIKDNVTGVMVKAKSPKDTAKAIISILRDNTRAGFIANNAKAYCKKKFSIDRCVEDYNKIYTKLSKN